jgi:hAT family C-terminal dimerisation region
MRQLVGKKSEKLKTLISFVSGLTHYKDTFPEVYRLGKIAIALPVGTAACERSFSALRLIKTWVRNSIGHSKDA